MPGRDQILLIQTYGFGVRSFTKDCFCETFAKNFISPAGFEPATARILKGIASITDYNLALYQLSYRENLDARWLSNFTL